MKRRTAAALAVLVAAFAWSSAAHAHGVGTSQLRLHIAGPVVDGAWEVTTGDALTALDGPDADATRRGPSAYAALAGRGAALGEYLRARFAVSADGHECRLTPSSGPLEPQPEVDQVRLRFAVACPAEPLHLAMRCDLLFDRQPTHRAYYGVEDATATQVGLFRDGRRAAVIDVRVFHVLPAFFAFVGEGITHVLSGADHLLFLLALLLPAPLLRAGGRWTPGSGLWDTAREVVKVVTSFTAAHSVTLGLAFFGWISLPARWVEVGIALSVFAAAWNNVRPFLPGRAWAMAMAFGLVHGLGFAGALRNLELPLRARGLALAAFNVGVELGQLAIVVAVLPLLVVAARRRWYPRAAMGGASVGVAWLAVIWVLERAFGWTILPTL